MREVLHAGSIEAARAIAGAQPGPYLVIDGDTLQWIINAEAAGGFQGGMTGNSGGAPYSGVGNEGDPSSPSGVPGGIEPLDMNGAWPVITIEDAIEKALDLKDVIESFLGDMVGPMIVVPKTELERWLSGLPPTDSA